MLNDLATEPAPSHKQKLINNIESNDLSVLALMQIDDSMKYLVELAIGGTAVGTGLNSHPEFSSMVSDSLNELTQTKYKFISHPNKFHALTAHDGEVFLSGALNALAKNKLFASNFALPNQ